MESLIDEEELRAVNEVLKGRKVNVLLGIGSLQHTEHCFSLGFPDILVLFDPKWNHENNFGYDLRQLEQIRDKDIPVKLIPSGGNLDIAEFSFQGRQKMIYYYKQMYDPKILRKFQPEIFHLGHRSVDITDEELQASLLLLPKGAIILNVVWPLQAAGIGKKLARTISMHYFLDTPVYYMDDEGVEYGLAVKSRDIDPEKLRLVFQFAGAFATLLERLRNKEYIEGELMPHRKEWEELEARVHAQVKKEGGIPKEHQYLGLIRKHEQKMDASLKALAVLKSRLTPEVKQKLLSIIDQLSNVKRIAGKALQEAMAAAGLQ